MNKVTVIERLATQASRLEAIANTVGDFLGHQSDLYQRLHQEVVVTKSIFNQVQDEATAKVEETAAKAEMPKNYDNDGGPAPSGLRPVPPEVQAVLDSIVETFKEAGIEVEMIQMPTLHRGPLNIADILKKL